MLFLFPLLPLTKQLLITKNLKQLLYQKCLTKIDVLGSISTINKEKYFVFVPFHNSDGPIYNFENKNHDQSCFGKDRNPLKDLNNLFVLV